MTTFRFIHTADIHLDSPLKGLAGYDGPAAESIRTATRQAFDNLITEAITQDVAFVIIAGDLYDGDWRDYQTGLFFARQMGRLAKAGIPAFVLHGNHDAESQITKRLILPDSVKVFSSRKCETFTLPELGVALHGLSFRQRDISDNLVPSYPEPLAGSFNIGVLHTGLGGVVGHENYAPCALDELVAKGYRYWALGHVHSAAILHESPHIVFSGNLQGRHIRETSAKSAWLVSVRDHEVEDLSPLYADVVRWSHLKISVQDCARYIDALDRLRNAIEQEVFKADKRLVACRIELTGRSEAHESLVSSQQHLLAEARAAALACGDDAAWIERVVVSTEPSLDPAILAAREDALGDLFRVLDNASTDSDLLGQLETDIGDLVRKLPSEIRSDGYDALLNAAVRNDYAGVIAGVRGYLNVRLADRRE